MGLKKLFVRVYAIIFIILVFLILLTVLFFQENVNLIKTNDIRHRSCEIAEELRKSSDDLTSYCKMFVETRDTAWKLKYYKIIDIRNGKSARSDGKTLSLRDSMVKLGFSDVELEKLREAEFNSNELVKIEEKAMNAAEGLFMDNYGSFTIRNNPDLILAKQLLYNEEYLQRKHSIINPIDSSIALIKERTDVEVEKQKRKNNLLLTCTIIIVFFISTVILISFFTIYKTIKKEFKELEDAKNTVTQSKDNFRFLFDSSPDIILITTPEGKLIESNKAGLALHGVSSIDELKNINTHQIYKNQKDREEIVKEIKAKGFVRNKNIELLSLKTNSIISCLLSCEFKNISKNQQVLISWIRNITEIKEAEKTILKLSTAVMQSPAAIVITDLTGRIEFVNKQFTNITGYTPEQAYGQNPKVLNSGYHPKEFFTKLWSTILSGNIWKGEIYNKRIDGTFFWEDATMAPILNESGEIINIVAIKQDITAKKEFELALIESQKQLRELNEIKDKLFSIIGHDLRAPIGNIKSFLELIISNESYNDYQAFKHIFSSLLTSTTSTFDLLENLLMWAKSQQNTISFNINDLDIHFIVDNTIELLSEIALNKSISIKNNIPLLSIIPADENMITTVVRNLLINAIKFTNIGKNITVSLEKTDSMFVVSVKDEGIGISQESIKTLFDPSVKSTRQGTSGEQGTGLGLLLCKEFVEKHNGKIWVESEVDVGSDFKFSIPTNPNKIL